MNRATRAKLHSRQFLSDRAGEQCVPGPVRPQPWRSVHQTLRTVAVGAMPILESVLLTARGLRAATSPQNRQ